ncbi:hypothetical protein [Halopseudomonas sabulinigri]|uniref:Uncharacterized protein n=1 Tax=Halopseudomonas sabulinigri TaxID=472181 RepID=A0ABP9ZTM4_9GAMM
MNADLKACVVSRLTTVRNADSQAKVDSEYNNCLGFLAGLGVAGVLSIWDEMKLCALLVNAYHFASRELVFRDIGAAA